MTNFLNAFDYYYYFGSLGTTLGGAPGSEAWKAEEVCSYSYSEIWSGQRYSVWL